MSRHSGLPFFASMVGLTSLASVAVAQGGVWVNRSASPLASCAGSLLAFDRARGESVWFGSQGCAQTWLWNGSAWQQRTSSPSPPAGPCVGAYDSSRQVVVAVSGNQSTGMQTWEWNGLTWQLRGTGPSPARQAFGVAFDEARSVTVLFGGHAGNEVNSFGQTWTWNGTTWTLVMQGGPLPRSSPGMTYDVQRQKVLLFAGQGQFGGQPAFFGDTWEWNGTQWSAHFGIAGPSPRRANGVLVYDRLRNRTVLHGGSNASSTLQDTWEWNGSAWAQLNPQGVPATYLVGVVHDDARGVLVTVNDTYATWEYVAGAAVAATFATYGTGCAGPAGVPALSNVAGSLPRIGSTLQLQLTNLPPAFVNVPIGFIGFDATSWMGMPLPVSLAPLGFPGCHALLAPIRSDGLTNVSGVATWNIALPMNALALGVDIYFQGAVLVAGWNPGGFVFSNGGHAVVGSP